MANPTLKRFDDQPEPVRNAIPDKAKVMYDALVLIAHHDGFFDGEKRLIAIARKAIQQVTEVANGE